MLLSSSCCLSTLGLKDQSNIDDEIATILSSGLNGNGTLTELDLSGSLECTRLTAIGWQAIFEQLKSASCMINTLNLGSNNISDISDTLLPFLISALSNNKTVKDLNLNSLENGNFSLQAIVQFLQSPIVC